MKTVKYTMIKEWTCRDGYFKISKKVPLDESLIVGDRIDICAWEYLVDRVEKTIYLHCGFTDSSTYDLSNDPDYKGWKIDIQRGL